MVQALQREKLEIRQLNKFLRGVMFVKSLFLICIMFSVMHAKANEPEPDNLFTQEAKLKKANQKPEKSNKTAASKKWMDGRIPEDKSLSISPRSNENNGNA
jgi:hypothetical protein